VPALGFFNVYPMRYSYVADHFQYIAGPALIALIVAGMAKLIARIQAKRLPYALSGLVLVVLAVMTLLQSRVYADSLALWRDTARKNPSSWMVQNNLGTSLYIEAIHLPPDRAEEEPKMLDDAIEHLQAAVALKPDHDKALVTWGWALRAKGKPDEALDKFDRAIAINQHNVEAWSGRGSTLLQLKRSDEAADSFRHGVAESDSHRGVWPRLTVAALHQNLASIAETKGDLKEALREMEMALVVAPNVAANHYEYAKLLLKSGDRPRAAEELGKAIELEPQDLDPHLELAQLRMDVGNLNGARAELIVAGGLARTYPETVTVSQSDRLLTLGKRWSDAFEASTRPSTTRSATTRSSTLPATTRSGK
jgi:tetratricopeptide (TPR) repeat protein